MVVEEAFEQAWVRGEGVGVGEWGGGSGGEAGWGRREG